VGFESPLPVLAQGAGQLQAHCLAHGIHALRIVASAPGDA
jgi:hypothetical protein